MLREGREHGVGAASPRRGISTLSLSTHSVLSLVEVLFGLVARVLLWTETRNIVSL